MKFINRVFLITFFLELCLLYSIHANTTHYYDFASLDNLSITQFSPLTEAKHFNEICVSEGLEWDEENEEHEKKLKIFKPNSYALFGNDFYLRFKKLANAASIGQNFKEYTNYSRSSHSLVVYFHRWKFDI